MCLIVLAHHADPNLPLAVAANRDEFHARPTAASAFWPESPGLLAGKDLELGGTWMGVTRSGRFAAVTNFRDPSHTAPAPRSRGELPLDFLQGRQTPSDYLEDVAQRAQCYAGFNLLVGDTRELWYFDNAPGDAPQALAPGIYGLSNARLDTPWPKVKTGKRALQQLVATGTISHDSLAATVSDRRLANPEELHGQNMPVDMAHLLSAQFILSEGYGTRATTTLWFDRSGNAHWRERSFNAAGNVTAELNEKFAITTAQ